MNQPCFRYCIRTMMVLKMVFQTWTRGVYQAATLALHSTCKVCWLVGWLIG